MFSPTDGTIIHNKIAANTQTPLRTMKTPYWREVYSRQNGSSEGSVAEVAVHWSISCCVVSGEDGIGLGKER